MKKFDVAIRCKTLVRASAERVYAALSTSAGWDSWFTTGTEFELKPSGKVVFRWKNWGADRVSLDVRAEVVDFEKDRLVRFLWNYGLAGGPTSVELKLTPCGSETLLEVMDSGYPDTPEGHAMFNECATGWGEAITLLKVYLEHGICFK